MNSLHALIPTKLIFPFVSFAKIMDDIWTGVSVEYSVIENVQPNDDTPEYRVQNRRVEIVIVPWVCNFVYIRDRYNNVCTYFTVYDSKIELSN